MNTLVLLATALCLSPGTAQVETSSYESDNARKVVYDLKTGSMDEFANVRNRIISYLNSRLGSDPLSTSIVVVMHGDEICYFARERELDHEQVLARTRSMTTGETIEFRVCKVSAKRRGYRPQDLQSFVSVVPMADAEIVQLQYNGYAYMR